MKESEAIEFYRNEFLAADESNTVDPKEVPGLISNSLCTKHAEDLLAINDGPMHVDEITCGLYMLARVYKETADDPLAKWSYIWFVDWLQPQYEEVIARKPDYEVTDDDVKENIRILAEKIEQQEKAAA